MGSTNCVIPLMTLTQLKDHRNFYDRLSCEVHRRGVDEEFFFSHANCQRTA